jgi:hypothetical protein
MAFGGESRLRSEGGRVKDPKSHVGDTERNTNMSMFKHVPHSLDISETIAMNRCRILIRNKVIAATVRAISLAVYWMISRHNGEGQRESSASIRTFVLSTSH